MRQTCCAEVGRGVLRYNCGVGAAYEFAGKHYCKRHHLPTAQAKIAARQAVVDAQDAALNEVFAAQDKAREDAKADMAALRAFAHACLSLWPYRGIDDDDLEELAVKYGLLERAIVYRACNAADPSFPCHCSAGGGFSAEDRAEGVLCMRKTQRLLDCAPSKEQT